MSDEEAPGNAMISLDLSWLRGQAQDWFEQIVGWAQSPVFYAQLGLIVGALLVAWAAAGVARRFLPETREQPQAVGFATLRRLLGRLRHILFPIFAVLLLGVSVQLSEELFGEGVIVRLAQGLSVVALIYTATRIFFDSAAVRAFAKWVVVPIALLNVFGALGTVTEYLESIRINAGNISFSLYAILRALIFGAVLFWFGRISNDTGKQYIRSQEALEVGTREVFAKLFEIGIFVVIFLLLLQVMGINLTTLAVFGGALGVGLGFGLQAIASNFISGIIILLDRSLTVGDYIELEDGRTGTIRALNMRSTVLKTFDGKDIVVPNETFITASFTNWTQTDPKQRYAIEFQVAYSTDMDRLLPLLKTLVASHPQVIAGPDYSEEEQPDAEISGFGDSGVDILIEYWMEGIDDGRNRVDADLKLMIWQTLKAEKFEFPFPQREVRILNPEP
ncbi:MAG: mechanosensitive ion channel domain-containing protein [Pseudomonadota bacterium]